MAKASTRGLHKSVDIARQPHSVTPLRSRPAGSPPRALSQHYISTPSTALQAKEVYQNPSPYTHSRPASRPRSKMRDPSPMIKKISSSVALRGVRVRSRGHRSSEADSLSVDRSLLEQYTSPAVAKTTSASFCEGQGQESPRSLGFFQEARILEMRLNQRLAETRADEDQKHQAYSDIFQQVIYQDKPFTGVLTRLKKVYDSAYSEVVKGKHLQATLTALEADYQREKEERRFVYKKLDKLAKENLELSKGLDERDGDYTELKEKLNQISQIDTRGIPKNESSWRTLVAENQSYQELFARMDHDISLFKKREKRLVKLVLAMKNRGYPVDTVYEEDVHNAKKKTDPMPSATSGAVNPAKSDDSDTPVSTERPPDPTEAEKKEGHPTPQSLAGPAESKKNPVPPLVLPPGQENGFHQEFLAKIDEFSESWRKQIQSDHQAVVP